MSKNVIQEHVIQLGAQVDNAGVNHLLSLLDSSKLKALGVAGAISALTTGIYKFVEAATKREFELEKLAKQQKKNISLTRAENAAMQAMGKTLQEINKDQNLKKIYQDIRDFNKEIAFPNMDQSLTKIRNLEGAFWKLRSVLGYATQWINAQILTNLERPIDRITEKLDKGSKWLRDNMTVYGSKIALFISDFAKGLIGIVEGFGKIFSVVNQLPDGIKAVGVAIAAIIAMFKTGPIGQLLALVTAVGDVMHDYDNYKWNQENLAKGNDDKTKMFVDKDGNPISKSDKNFKDKVYTTPEGLNIVYQIPIAAKGIWDIVDSESDPREKATQITQKITGGIGDILTNIVDALNTGEGLGIREVISKLTGPLGEIFGGIVDYLGSEAGLKDVSTIAQRLFESLSSVLKSAGDFGVDITGALAELIAAVFGGENWQKAWDQSKVNDFLSGENGIATGLATALETALVGGNFIQSALTGALSAYQKEKEKAAYKVYQENERQLSGKVKFGKDGKPLFSSIMEAISEDAQLGSEYNKWLGTGFTTDLNDAFNAMLETISSVLTISGETAGKLAKTLFTTIFEALGSDTGIAALKAIGDNNAIWDGIANGIVAGIISGNGLVGIVTGIATAITEAQKSEDGWKALQDAAGEFVEMFNTLLYGAFEEDGKTRNGRGLINFFKQLWEGEGGEGGLKAIFTDLAGKIGEWLKPVTDAIVEWFSGLLDNLWIAMYNGMPEWLKAASEILLGHSIENPNKSSISQDKNGDYYLKSTNGQQLRLTPEQAASLMQTNKFMDNLEGGTILDQIYVENGKIFRNGKGGYSGEELGDENGFGPALQTMIDQRTYWNLMEGLKDGTSSVDDFAGMTDDSTKKMSKIGTTAEEIVSAIKAVVEKLKQIKIPTKVGFSQSSDESDEDWDVFTFEQENALGGRFGSKRTHQTLAEDGTEYVIPITKPERAFPLIDQMISEMGAGAIRHIQEAFGIGNTAALGTIGGSLDSIIGSMGGAGINISAPVNIYVTATGSDAKEIGTAAYDAAERHLVKTLRGVSA